MLPSLGEESVQICTLRDFVAEGAAAGDETDSAVAALKASAKLIGVVESAVKFYEQPPAAGLTIETPWEDVWLSAAEWAEAFEAAGDGTPHNEARDQVWNALLDIVIDHFDTEEVPPHVLRRWLVQNGELTEIFAQAWPVLDPVGIIADLWSVPAYLRKCAPWLSADEVQALQRQDARAWTVADLAFLDAARQRVGDPEASRLQRRRDAAIAAERERMDGVIDDLIAAQVHDDGEGVMTMLRGADLRNSLDDDAALATATPDLLAGPFAHIIVDEAQELTDAQWQMLLRRCPSRRFTIVGDRAQARHGFRESWQERLGRLGVAHVDVATLSINYRTPEEVMREAEPVIRSVLPGANVPTSIRRSGVPVVHRKMSELGVILDEWLAAHEDGIACVIAWDKTLMDEVPASSRVRRLTPESAKGLEFDLVVLIDPQSFGAGIEGSVDRYVAMTRTRQKLVILNL